MIPTALDCPVCGGPLAAVLLDEPHVLVCSALPMDQRPGCRLFAAPLPAAWEVVWAGGVTLPGFEAIDPLGARP